MRFTLFSIVMILSFIFGLLAESLQIPGYPTWAAKLAGGILGGISGGLLAIDYLKKLGNDK